MGEEECEKKFGLAGGVTRSLVWLMGEKKFGLADGRKKFLFG